MKLEVRRHGSADRVVIDANSIAIKPPPDSEYILEATVEEGDSPIMILTSNRQVPMAVKQLRLTRTSTSRVKRHMRNWPRKPSTVSEHDRRKPVNLKRYEQWKRGVSDALKAYWARMTPAEKRAEQLRRQEKGRARKADGGRSLVLR